MTQFTFCLSDADTDRLFAVKELQGKQNLTGNQFARQLLEDVLFRLFPPIPQYDQNGRLINQGSYRGE